MTHSYGTCFTRGWNLVALGPRIAENAPTQLIYYQTKLIYLNVHDIVIINSLPRTCLYFEERVEYCLQQQGICSAKLGKCNCMLVDTIQCTFTWPLRYCTWSRYSPSGLARHHTNMKWYHRKQSIWVGLSARLSIISRMPNGIWTLGMNTMGIC